MKHRIAKGRTRLAALFTAAEPHVIRSFFQEHKKQLMMPSGGGFRLDNVPADSLQLLALATKVPPSQHPQLLKALRAAAPKILPSPLEALTRCRQRRASPVASIPKS